MGADIEAVKDSLEADIAALGRSHDPTVLALETETLKPTRTGIRIDHIALLWLPYDDRDHPAW